jgi:hypothetical protein
MSPTRFKPQGMDESVPAWLQAIILDAISPTPEKRPSASALHQRLLRAWEGSDVTPQVGPKGYPPPAGHPPATCQPVSPLVTPCHLDP